MVALLPSMATGHHFISGRIFVQGCRQCFSLQFHDLSLFFFSPGWDSVHSVRSVRSVWLDHAMGLSLAHGLARLAVASLPLRRAHVGWRRTMVARRSKGLRQQQRQQRRGTRTWCKSRSTGSSSRSPRSWGTRLDTTWSALLRTRDDDMLRAFERSS